MNNIDKILKELRSMIKAKQLINTKVGGKEEVGVVFIKQVEALIHKALEEQEKHLNNECAKSITMIGSEFKKKIEEKKGLSEEKIKQITCALSNASYQISRVYSKTGFDDGQKEVILKQLSEAKDITALKEINNE